MADYATLKAAIQQVVKTNGNNEITGALLQQSLLAMINSLGADYQFAGVATPSTNPGTPDQNIFYIASNPGIYANFNSLTINDGEIAIFKYNGTWTKELTGAINGQKVTNRATSVNNALYAVRATTSSYSLVDNPNGTRLRLVFPVRAGDLIKISSTFKSGYSCGIWNTPANCVYAGSTGQLQLLVSGYVTTPLDAIANVDGYLGISFSNGSSAISDSLKQIMLDSLTLYVGGDVAFETYTIKRDMVKVAQYDKSEFPHTVENGIVYPTGARASSDQWRRYIFKNLGFDRIVARLYTSTSYLAIGFYNSDEWGQASFISGIVGLQYTQNYDVRVPDGCKTIVVCNWNSYLDAPTITLYQNNYKAETIDLYNRIQTNDSGIADINKLLKDFTITGKGNTASTIDIYSFIPGKKYRLSIDNPSWAIDGVTVGGSYNCIYIAAYDENNTRIGNADLYGRKISNYPCPQDIDFTAPIGTKYIRFGIRANDGTVVHFSSFDITLVSEIESHIQIGSIEGIGKINLTSKFKEETRNRYINQTLFDTSIYSVGVQSLAIYNDTYAIYGICATDKNDSEIQKCGIVIDDIANRTVLLEFEITTTNTKAHANNINLGEKYDAGDVLPLLYVSLTYNTKECVVLRVANDFSGYTEIQKITYEGTQHFENASSYDWILDGYYIWAYGAYDDDSIEFVKFLKRSTSFPTIGFDDSDVLDSFVVGNLRIRQGAFIRDNKIYMGLGYSAGAEFIKVLNIVTRDIETVIPVNYEPEGITIYTGKVCVCSSTYHLKTYSDAF